MLSLSTQKESRLRLAWETKSCLSPSVTMFKPSDVPQNQRAVQIAYQEPAATVCLQINLFKNFFTTLFFFILSPFSDFASYHHVQPHEFFTPNTSGHGTIKKYFSDIRYSLNNNNFKNIFLISSIHWTTITAINQLFILSITEVGYFLLNLIKISVLSV